MNLASLSVKRPVFVTSVFLAILATGALAISRLGAALYPDVSFPVVNVIVPFPGAGPQEAEEQIAKPLEDALSPLAGVRTIRSTSLDNAAIVSAVFAMNSDIRFAEQNVIQAVARTRGKLPQGIQEPVIRSVDPADTPVLTLSLSADLPEGDLSDLAYREVSPLIEQVESVGEIQIQGARKREVQVELDLDELRAHEMTAGEVVGRLGASGMNIPAGTIGDNEQVSIVRSIGQFDSLEAIRKTPIRFVGNEAATLLGDVATVRDGLEDETTRVYADGKRALTIKIFRRSGANAVEASDRVQERVAEINSTLGPKFKGFQLSVLRDGAKPIREGIRGAAEAIFVGIILTVLVVLIFLGSIRSTLITAIALPNSLLGAFLFMWIAGFSINITTLAALALAVGLLIDDAIVVRENIFRRLQSGEAPESAAVLGTQEVALAVVATTLTVLSVFAPTSFLQGLIGQFFKEFGLTICFAMLISLLDSLTIAPMLSAKFAGGAAKSLFPRVERLQERLSHLYARALESSMKRPSAVLAGAAAIFGLSFVVLAHIPKSFVPSQETGEFQVVLSQPAGTSLAGTDRMVQEADKILRARPDVARTVTSIGNDLGEVHHAEILVLLRPLHQGREFSSAQIKDQVRHALGALGPATLQVEDLLDIGGGAGRSFVFNLTGDDLEELKATSEKIVDRLKRDPDLTDVDRSYHPGAQELRWTLNPARTDTFGVSSAEVGQELRLLIAGASPARLRDRGKDYDIHVRLRADQRDILRNPSHFLVPNLNHRLIPITSVAEKSETAAPGKIERQDRKRFIEISADVNPTGRGLAAAIAETRRILNPGSGELALPPGVHYEFSGQTKDFQELLSSVFLALALSVGAMYFVLASLYESFVTPLAIMLVLPLAICGAFYGLWITHSNLDIYSMIGCVLLLGVSAKNSILLVDYIQQFRKKEGLRAAILDAGRLRLRPILMTSFALVAGMLPVAIPMQEAAHASAPMAIAIIGGVVSSTLLTLFVVPAAVTLFSRERASR